MLKIEVKNGTVGMDMQMENKKDAYSDFYVAAELVLHRFHLAGASKKELVNLLKLIIKDVKKGFPKFDEWCANVLEEEDNTKEGE